MPTRVFMGMTLALALAANGFAEETTVEVDVAIEEEEWGAPEDLVSDPAPAIVLDLLGGGRLDLAEHAGERYVVLNFWTTWCPWCRREAEDFEKLIATHAGADEVAFYMVSVGEERETVAKYAEEHGLKARIALDEDRAVSDKYWVDLIPQLVIVDKDGAVKHVSIGYGNTAETLEDALGDALAAETS